MPGTHTIAIADVDADTGIRLVSITDSRESITITITITGGEERSGMKLDIGYGLGVWCRGWIDLQMEESGASSVCTDDIYIYI